MDPICFTLGNRPIYWYGVMVALGFMAGILNWTLLGRREGKTYAYASDLGVWLMLSGIFGARAAYVLANWPTFSQHPATILRLDQGGLVFFGGFLAAIAAGIVFARVKRENLWAFTDFAVTAVPLGHAMGRVGCFLNGCCYGTAGAAPWSVFVEGQYRHPTPLYEAAANGLLYLVLLVAYARKKRDGTVLALYLFLYPAARFALEFLRGDPRLRLLGLTVAQVLSLLLILAAVALWLLRPRGTVLAPHPGKDRYGQHPRTDGHD